MRPKNLHFQQVSRCYCCCCYWSWDQTLKTTDLEEGDNIYGCEKVRGMKTNKESPIGFSNCFLVTFEMEFTRVMKITKGFEYIAGEEIKATCIYYFKKRTSSTLGNIILVGNKKCCPLNKI